MSTSTSTNPPPSLAILDDYANLAPAHFTHLTTPDPPRLTLTSLPATLPPTTSDPTHADHAALIARLKPHTILSTMRERTPFPASVLSALPNLRLLLTTGLRNAAIDLQAATSAGITVAGTTGLPRPSSSTSPAAPKAPNTPAPTTQHTWALILALARHIPRDHAAVTSTTLRTGWQGSPLAQGLPGKTLGILGLGKLGAEVAAIGALAFGMRVVCWSRSLSQARADEVAAAKGLPAGSFEVMAGEGGKEEVCRRADVLSLHLVLGEASRGVVGRRELGVMKPGAVLVNTSRGPLVDEGALLEVLGRGGIRGAGLDVFWEEPLPEASPWRTTEWGVEGRSEVVLTPHMGYGEEELMQRWYEETAENVERWLDGREVLNRMN